MLMLLILMVLKDLANGLSIFKILHENRPDFSI